MGLAAFITRSFDWIGAPLRRDERAAGGSGMDAAGGGRRVAGWGAYPGSQAAAMRAAAPRVGGRAAAQARNSPALASAVAAWVAAVCGSGFVPAPLHPNRDTRHLLLAIWKQFAAECDVEGLLTFDALIALAVRQLVEVGESFIRLVETPDGLRLQLLPAEMVDGAITRELAGGGRIVAGVEYDGYGRRVAYWVNPVPPDAAFPVYALPVRVAAGDVLHLMQPLAPGQVRGLSWLHVALARAADLGELQQALLVGVKIAAMHAGFLIDQNGAAGVPPFDGVQVGSVLESGLEPGTLRTLPAGFDIKFSTPAQAQQVAEFLSATLRDIASAVGVPAHLVSADVGQANYSSLRAALLDFGRRVEAVQYGLVVPQLLRPIWRRVMVAATLASNLTADDLADAQEVEWRAPPMGQVDPLKDTEAAVMAVANGFTSRSRVLRERGEDPEAVDAERAADAEREKSLGLPATPLPQQEQPKPLGPAL